MTGGLFQSRWRWLLMQITRRIVFRASAIAGLSVLSAIAAVYLKRFIPDDLAYKIGADAVDDILTIIANSMLAVTTFSLSTVVAAYAYAASNASPRATDLLLADTRAQTMMSTFVGAFIYALVGLILLKTGLYGASGRVVLFAVTILVLVLLIATLLRWIDFLLHFGRLNTTIRQVGEAARETLQQARDTPCLGGVPMPAGESAIPSGLVALHAREIGYIRHVDVEALSEAIEKAGGRLWLHVRPGAYIHPGRPLMSLDVDLDDALADTLLENVTIGRTRSFDQDPRFGMVVLAEIGSRALSPGINDPGTAIAVIDEEVSLLAEWAKPPQPGRDDGPFAPGEIRFPRLHVPEISLDELFEEAFQPIARDGASIAEVQIRLQQAFAQLALIGESQGSTRFRAAALQHSALSLERARDAMQLRRDVDRVAAAASRVGQDHRPGRSAQT